MCVRETSFNAILLVRLLRVLVRLLRGLARKGAKGYVEGVHDVQGAAKGA